MIDQPCNDLKTLTITYTSSSIMPDTGYTVQWRIVGSDNWYTQANKKANPIVIAGVPSCYPLEVRLLANCGTGLEVVETFGVSGGYSASCQMYRLLDSAAYTYTPCNSTTAATVYNVVESPQQICAVANTVSGGQYTAMGSCLSEQP